MKQVSSLKSTAPWILLLGVFAHAAAPDAQTSPAPETDSLTRVTQLIEQLGAPKYVLRQAAAQELSTLGLVAFDQLLLAADDNDPEVAAASQRLLETMTVRWTRPGDPPEVRRLLQSYGEYNDRRRREAVAVLARLPDQLGVDALARIARFEPSERLSREAALRLIEPAFSGWDARRTMAARDYVIPLERIAALKAAEQELVDEYGESQRAAGRWLRLIVEQADNPAATIDRWRDVLDAEQQAIDNRHPFTDEVIVDSLRWNWFRVQLAAGRDEKLGVAVDLLVQGAAQDAEAALTQALEWMVEAEANSSIDQVLNSRREQLTSKRGLYLAATIRQQQGRDEDADQLAQQALAAEPAAEDAYFIEDHEILDGRVIAGMRLEGDGHIEWARREYNAAAEKTDDLSINSIYARQLLASSLLDHQEHSEAAAALDKCIKAIEKDAKTRGFYRHCREKFDRLLPVETLAARRDYNRALAANLNGDAAEEVAQLEAAWDHDPTDADILIAMYRAQGADEAFRKKTLELIEALAQATQEQIDQDADAREAALPYNQWAWLISNTEGDYAKAIRYSEKSLQLRPGDAGFLDTLGRCYYAIGDLERAVETQRKAVAKQPTMQVMQRQLELFEKELAESRDGQSES